MKKQTAGRTNLGDFAPKFAELNDDVPFGEVWSREDRLSARDRSLVTVTALMAQGLTDSSFRLPSAKWRRTTASPAREIAEILTHAAFYAGWPKAWAAFRMAKEVWTENEARAADAMAGARRSHGLPHRRAQRRLCAVFHRARATSRRFRRGQVRHRST